MHAYIIGYPKELPRERLIWRYNLAIFEERRIDYSVLVTFTALSTLCLISINSVH